uniref:Uncharacterized protein n=1 Tax=Magallana gigas TaxID=29159 RepID=A0A8W8MD39_MAGGI
MATGVRAIRIPFDIVAASSMFNMGGCLVDSGLGHIRKLFRRSDVDALSHLVDVVQKSASSTVAFPYQQDCTKTWEWFPCEDPGYVFLKESVDSVETQVSILKNVITDPQTRPRVITPPGLSGDQQLYLYRNVRPYVRQQHRDDVCPPPTKE